jgi:uncharacterized protein (TIGR02145 family)
MKSLLYIIFTVSILIACQSCKKDPNLPLVETLEMYGTTSHSFYCGGIIRDDGDAPIIACGICFGSNPFLNLDNADSVIPCILTDNSFRVQITISNSYTTYRFRAFATNKVGTSYGVNYEFKSGYLISPTVTLLEVSEITTGGAKLQASVNPNEFETKIEFVCGTDTNNLDKTACVSNSINGDQDVIVSTAISGLLCNKMYYYRVNAVNSIGKTTSSIHEFNTTGCAGPGLVDIDGNIYKTITIGNQTWMAENLKVTHYNDGTLIPNVLDSVAWMNLKTGAYCDYSNDARNSDIYGRLYNFYAVNTKKLAPPGWHVPSLIEWFQLFYFTKENSGPLKEAGYSHWYSPNTGATNYAGFNALPNGGRLKQYDFVICRFIAMHYNSTWWASDADQLTENYALMLPLSLDEDKTPIGGWIMWAYDGYAVRLVKND